MIKLGDKVRDTISGLVGTAVSRTEYLNGCVQYGVQPKFKKDGTELPTWNIDGEQLEVVGKKKIKTKREPNGGPTSLRPRRYV